MYIVQIITQYPLGVGGEKNKRLYVRRISQMYFLTINRNIWAVQIQPFPVKDTSWWCILVLFFWHVFLIIIMMIWKPPKVDSEQKNANTDQNFFPKARECILGVTLGQSPSSKFCCSEPFSSEDISFSEYKIICLENLPKPLLGIATTLVKKCFCFYLGHFFITICYTLLNCFSIHFHILFIFSHMKHFVSCQTTWKCGHVKTDGLLTEEAEYEGFRTSRLQQSLVLDIALEVVIFDNFFPNPFYQVSLPLGILLTPHCNLSLWLWLPLSTRESVTWPVLYNLPVLGDSLALTRNYTWVCILTSTSHIYLS